MAPLAGLAALVAEDIEPFLFERIENEFGGLEASITRGHDVLLDRRVAEHVLGDVALGRGRPALLGDDGLTVLPLHAVIYPVRAEFLHLAKSIGVGLLVDLAMRERVVRAGPGFVDILVTRTAIGRRGHVRLRPCGGFGGDRLGLGRLGRFLAAGRDAAKHHDRAQHEREGGAGAKRGGESYAGQTHE